MAIKIILLTLIMLFWVSCCPCGVPETVRTDPPPSPLFSVPDEVLARILHAEDGRDGPKLMDILRTVKPGDVKTAARVALAAGRIADLSVWKHVQIKFGRSELVREALLTAVRCASPPYAPEEILPHLASFPENDSLCETLLYLDSDKAFERAISMSGTSQTAAFNLWRAGKRADEAVAKRYYQEWPGKCVYSLYRMRRKGIVRVDDLLELL